MERCPPEILHRIFTLICNDAGGMGRSLSLVSRYVHDASKSVRFQTVLCEGADQILSFASALHRTPPRHRLVRHLFVTCSCFNCPSALEATYTPKSHIAVHPTWRLGSTETPITFGTLMSRYKDALIVIPHILRLAAPALRSLTLYIDWPTPEPLFQSHFPSLVELAISQPWSGFQLRSQDLHQLVPCPSLRRFVLNGFVSVGDPVEIIAGIRRFAPFLTHLCLPLDASNPLLKHFGTVNKEPSPPEGALFPETLEILLYHCVSDYDGSVSRDGFRIDVVGRSWAYLCGGGGRHERQWGYQWFNGIQGGPGFWDWRSRFLPGIGNRQ